MANVKQQLETPSLPPLGYPPEVYDRRNLNENNGALNIFSRKLTSVLGSLFGPRGGKFMNNPHGAFQDNTDQVAANTTTAYPIAFSATDFSNGVTLQSGSQLAVAMDGIFNIQFSVQLKNTDNDGVDIDIWFRKNGTNIADSNSRFHLNPRKSSGDPSHLIASLNFFVSLAKDDYVQIVWRTDNVAGSIEHFAASASPTRPAVPSVIATVSFVSNLPTI
jgi:hypothetical protein